MYWALTSIDRELVFPKALDAFFHQWLDLILHTFVSVVTVLEIFVAKHQYPKRSQAIRGLAVFLLGYLVWIYYVKIRTGIWVYQIIGAFNNFQRIVFFAICGFASLGLYFLGELMNFLIVGKRQNIHEKIKSK